MLLSCRGRVICAGIARFPTRLNATTQLITAAKAGIGKYACPGGSSGDSYAAALTSIASDKTNQVRAARNSPAITNENN